MKKNVVPRRPNTTQNAVLDSEGNNLIGFIEDIITASQIASNNNLTNITMKPLQRSKLKKTDKLIIGIRFIAEENSVP